MTKCETPRCKGAPRDKRKKCQKCRVAAWRAAHPMAAAYASLKHHAKERGIPFDLTLEQFAEFAERTQLLAGRGKTKDSWHVDRIRNGEGYHVGNLQVLTNSQNASKENLRRKVAKSIDERNTLLEAGWPAVTMLERSLADEPLVAKRIVTYDYHQKVGRINRVNINTPPDPNIPF